MKTILVHMLLVKPIVLLIIEREIEHQPIDRICLAFRLPGNSQHFVITENLHYALSEQPCYIIRGITRYTDRTIESKKDLIRRISILKLEKVILMNMAIHPQYSGKSLASASVNPFSLDCIKEKMHDDNHLEQELLAMKMQAEIFGCGSNNPSLLYIKYIFCDQLKRQDQFICSRYLDKLPTVNMAIKAII